MHGIAHIQIDQIHFQIFRDVARQTVDFDFGQVVRGNAVISLDALTFFGVKRMQRYADADLFLGADTLKIHMHDHRLERMHLVIAQNGFFFLAVNIEADNGRLKRFIFQRMENLVLLHGNHRRIFSTAINDGRDFACMAHAARCGAACFGARCRRHFK